MVAEVAGVGYFVLGAERFSGALGFWRLEIGGGFETNQGRRLGFCPYLPIGPHWLPQCSLQVAGTQGATTVVPYAANVVVLPVQYNGCSCMAKSCKPTGLTKVVGWSLLCA